MKNYSYGFTLVALRADISKEGVIVVCGKNGPVRYSGLARAIGNPAKFAQAAGRCIMEATSRTGIICKLLVETRWVRHPKIAEPILGIISKESELIDTLRQYAGQPVAFKFQRIAAVAAKQPVKQVAQADA